MKEAPGNHQDHLRLRRLDLYAGRAHRNTLLLGELSLAQAARVKLGQDGGTLAYYSMSRKGTYPRRQMLSESLRDRQDVGRAAEFKDVDRVDLLGERETRYFMRRFR